MSSGGGDNCSNCSMTTIAVLLYGIEQKLFIFDTLSLYALLFTFLNRIILVFLRNSLLLIAKRLVLIIIISCYD